jgi:hypothetical protein
MPAMPLQVRLRHSLGERVLELPDRPATEPLLVGRAREADLQIPSTGASPQHGWLFVHEGQWTVQPAGGPITVNGQPISEATLLAIGDVIRLGIDANAPTIEIEPLAASQGRSGPAVAAPVSDATGSVAAATGGLRPISAARAPSRPSSTGAPLRRIGGGNPIVPASATKKEAVPEPAEGEDTIGWNPSSAGTETTRYYVPKGKRTSQEAVAVAVVVGLAVLGIAGYVAYSHTHVPPPPVVVAQAPPKVVVPKKTSMFDVDGDQAEALRQHAPPGSLPPPAPMADAPSAPAPSAAPPAALDVAPPPPPSSGNAQVSSANLEAQPADTEPPSGPADDEWNEIKGAHYDVRHQGLAIIKFDAYRRAHPGKMTTELDRYTEAAVNWLWWQRIAVLWKQRAEIDTLLRENAADQHAQPAGDFQKTLIDQKAELQAKEEKVNNALLTEMGYNNDLPPNLESPSNLQELALKRDPAKYAEFKRHILHYVRDNHGATWWDGE